MIYDRRYVIYQRHGAVEAIVHYKQRPSEAYLQPPITKTMGILFLRLPHYCKTATFYHYKSPAQIEDVYRLPFWRGAFNNKVEERKYYGAPSFAVLKYFRTAKKWRERCGYFITREKAQVSMFYMFYMSYMLYAL